MEENRLADLEVLLGHSFRDKNLLLNALSHASIKADDRPSNERLEFLGDSVLGLVVSEVLYRRFPDEDEGVLTRIKSHAVSRASLQRIAAALGLDRFILVGKGVLKREIPASLLGNLFEAIVGAMYLDTGLAAARRFILRHLDLVIDEIVEDRAERNYKSILQHFCQREHGAVPVYKVLREAGPAHNRQFDVAAMLHAREIGRARAVSKKEAEQGAARAGLIHFRQLDENPRQPVRGAGVVLSVGAPGARRHEEARERVVETAQRERLGEERSSAPAVEGGGRRRRRRRRGGGGPVGGAGPGGGGWAGPGSGVETGGVAGLAGGGGAEAAAGARQAEGPPPPSPGAEAPIHAEPAPTAQSSEGAEGARTASGGGEPRRRRRRRGGRGRGRRGEGAPGEPPPPPEPPPRAQ
jgi:ribonuclease-3